MYLQGLNFLRITCKICPAGTSLSMSLSAPTILLCLLAARLMVQELLNKIQGLLEAKVLLIDL